MICLRNKLKTFNKFKTVEKNVPSPLSRGEGQDEGIVKMIHKIIFLLFALLVCAGFSASASAESGLSSVAADNTTRYVFTVAELEEIAALRPDLPLGERWELMRAELAQRHPGKIIDTLHWTFNAAGNVVCQIAIVAASPREYVAFFGTPVGATGFSGRYNESDVWDIMVQGEMWACVPGQFDYSTYALGQTAYLKRGAAKIFRYGPGTWMIDYARGNILTMFPFGVIAPAVYNTLDFKSATEQFTDYAGLVIKGMLK
jgi:hypothetical protein